MADMRARKKRRKLEASREMLEDEAEAGVCVTLNSFSFLSSWLMKHIGSYDYLVKPNSDWISHI